MSDVEMQKLVDFEFIDPARKTAHPKIVGQSAHDIAAMAGFIASKYRTGEYFIRAGKMTIEQLDEVLNKQQEMNAEGKHVFIAELMVQMGFVREMDVKSIIFMKEESGKRFSLNPDEVPNMTLEQESYDIRVENTRLKEENEILKQKMDALLTFIKDHKEEE